MADDAYRTLTVPLSADELALMAAAAGDEVPEAWARTVLRSVALQVAGTADGPEAPLDEPVPSEEPDDGAPASLPVSAVDGAAVLLGEVRVLRAKLEEVLIWQKTVLAELYAHTVFPSLDEEVRCRAAADQKIRKMEQRIAAWLAQDATRTSEGGTSMRPRVARSVRKERSSGWEMRAPAAPGLSVPLVVEAHS